jgi:hypothetical protein
MNSLTRIAFLTTASLAYSAFAAEPDTSTRQMVALADTHHARAAESITAESLDDYAGRYETQDGIVFIVDRIGDSLVIELPETWALGSLTLRATSVHDFVAVEAPISVTFVAGSASPHGALLLYAPSRQEPVAAARVVMRGVVTLHDFDSAAISAFLASQ